jgi:hypothetical protein
MWERRFCCAPLRRQRQQRRHVNPGTADLGADPGLRLDQHLQRPFVERRQPRGEQAFEQPQQVVARIERDPRQTVARRRRRERAHQQRGLAVAGRRADQHRAVRRQRVAQPRLERGPRQQLPPARHRRLDLGVREVHRAFIVPPRRHAPQGLGRHCRVCISPRAPETTRRRRPMRPFGRRARATYAPRRSALPPRAEHPEQDGYGSKDERFPLTR